MPHRWLKDAIRRFCRYLSWTLTLGLMSAIVPILIPFSLPFISMYRFGYRIRDINWCLFGVIMLTYLIPWTRSWSMFLFSWWMNARCLLRELLDPFIGRERERFSVIYKRHEFSLLGFYFPFAIASQYPMLVPLVWIVGYSAAGTLVSRLHQRV